MTMTERPAAVSVDELADRVFAAALGAYDTLSVYLGERRRLVRHDARRGPADRRRARRSAAGHAGAVRPRVARAAGGQRLRHRGRRRGAGRSAPVRAAAGAAAEVLTDRSSLAYLAPLARFVAAAAGQLPALVDAYRHGGGVSWAEFGADARAVRPT